MESQLRLSIHRSGIPRGFLLFCGDCLTNRQEFMCFRWDRLGQNTKNEQGRNIDFTSLFTAHRKSMSLKHAFGDAQNTRLVILNPKQL
jgi:hypothetical protein